MSSLSESLAPAVFWLGYRLFRLNLAKTSRRKHRWLMAWFRFAADNGSVKAQSVYGHLLHFRGEGEHSRIRGVEYLLRAADQGDAKSQYQIGRISESGYGTEYPADQERAVRYFRLAADQQHYLAIKRLVDAYRAGELNLPCDPEAARQWQAMLPRLSKAAELDC